ncbi:hypothetical protein [Vogesella mureinivorans]|uniref:hypothetical protein n=1 Tax=Vogesella mureinivorans TaxID=657276 RepID=UPI0011CB43C5|nr:hypothetical protein [Vogesella mureinivorans]
MGGAYGEAPQKNESQVSECRQKKPLDAAQAKGVGRKPNRTAGSMGAPDPEDDPDDKYADKNYGGKKKSPQKKANENRQPASEKRVDKLGNDLEKK